MLRKVRDAILAYRLEDCLSKQEILNVYLNNIYIGEGVYGIEAASQVYFGSTSGRSAGRRRPFWPGLTGPREIHAEKASLVSPGCTSST